MTQRPIQGAAPIFAAPEAKAFRLEVYLESPSPTQMEAVAAAGVHARFNASGEKSFNADVYQAATEALKAAGLCVPPRLRAAPQRQIFVANRHCNLSLALLKH